MDKISVIDQFPQANVIVMGDVMLDVFDFCYTKESKPIDSEKLGKRAYKAQKSLKTMGGAGNVAMNLARLGAQTSLIAITGNDDNALALEELSEEQDIRHFLVRDRSRPTTIKSRLYIDDEYLLRRDDESSEEITRETSSSLLGEFRREIPESGVVILSDYNKGLFTEGNASEMIQLCRENDVKVVVDCKPPNVHLFKGASIICPNDKEADEMLPGFLGLQLPNDLGKLEELMKTLRAQVDCDKLVVTLGAQGICGYDGKDFFHVPGNQVKALDAVGCGDTVRAALALGFVLGQTLEDAADLANDAAAVVVQRVATSTLDAEDLREFINSKSS